MNYTETEFLHMNATTETKNLDEQGRHWYEQLLEDFDYEHPRRGQVLRGHILSIDSDAVLVDVGQKRDAIVPHHDLTTLTDQFMANLSIGDEVIVYVIRPAIGDQDLLVSLNKGIEHQSWDEIEEHKTQGTLLDVKVYGQNKGGLLVKYKSLDGFVPYSQIPQLRNQRDPRKAEAIKRTLTGEDLVVKVIEASRENERLVFSALDAQTDRRKQRLEELEKGQVAYGPVVNITPFGVFVDLDGVDGLVHVSELAWQRVNHPADIVKPGEEMEVQILAVDKEKERVSLSRKALLPNPWQVLNEQRQPGELVEGKVTRVVKFGAFVALPEGVEGLVHASQLGYANSPNPEESVRPGETVLARIISIDPHRERIALSMRQVPQEAQTAWALEQL